MHKNYFLDIIEPFKNIAAKIKANFISKPNLSDLLMAVEDCDVDKFEKLAKNISLVFNDYNHLNAAAIKTGNLNIFLKLSEMAPENDKLRFYKPSFIYSVYEDNDKVFKHIFENHIGFDDINRDMMLKLISEKKAYKVATVILYDFKFEVNEKMMEILNCDENGRTHTRMLKFIEKRDLYFQLNQDLDNNQTNHKPKPNKI